MALETLKGIKKIGEIKLTVAEKKMKYDEIQDFINLAQIKINRMKRYHEVGENEEIVKCLKGAVMWIDQLLLTMEE